MSTRIRYSTWPAGASLFVGISAYLAKELTSTMKYFGRSSLSTFPLYLVLLIAILGLSGCESRPIYYERSNGKECNLPNPDAPLKPISWSGQSLDKNGRFLKTSNGVYLLAVHGWIENNKQVAAEPTEAYLEFNDETLNLHCRNEANFSTYTKNPEFEAAKRRAAETGQSVDLVEYGRAKYQKTFYKPLVTQLCDVDIHYLLSLPRETSIYFTFTHPSLETRSGRFQVSDLPFCAKKYGMM